MERSAFTLLHEMESSWWYRGRRAVVQSTLARAGLTGKERSVLDFGAGYGGMETTLASHGSVDAFEPDAEARTALTGRGYRAIYDSVDTALARPYELIGLFDVLEHIEDDARFLRTLYDAVSDKGTVVFTVPAMPFLWSAHDVSHHHHRRYTKKTLRARLNAAGYDVEFISYWNFFLFFPAALTRLLGRSGEGSFHLPPLLDRLFYTLVAIEAFLMRFVSLPFGVSLVVLARKK